MTRVSGLRFYSPTDYLRRALWALVQPLWRWSPRGCWGWRNTLLRCFGARIGPRVRIYPAARLHQPWNLRIERDALISWDVILYSLGTITIGPECVVSQGAHLCAGSHDFRDPTFPLLRPPIRLGTRVWVAAQAFVGPGVTIGDDAVVGARAVVCRDVAAGSVVAGNPARPVGRR